MTLDDAGITFSTGKHEYAHARLLSVKLFDDGEWQVSHGYDGHVDLPSLTAEERREMADYMIALWTRFRDESGEIDKSR